MELTIRKDLSLTEKCFNSPRIMLRDQLEVKRYLLAIISKTMFHNGQKIDEDTKFLLVEEFYKEIENTPKFKNLTAKEIEVAFHKGVRGEYGEFYGLSVVTFTKWIKSFLESEYRANKIIEATNEKKEIKEIDPDQAHKDYLEKYLYPAYEDYLAGKEFKCYGWKTLLDLLVKNGFCQFTKKVKDQIKTEAIYKAKEKVMLKRSQDPMNKKLLDLIREFKVGEIKNLDWRSEGYKIAVMMQLEMFKEMEEDIKLLIN